MKREEKGRKKASIHLRGVAICESRSIESDVTYGGLMPSKKRSVTCRLEDEELGALERLAELQGVSITRLATRALQALARDGLTAQSPRSEQVMVPDGVDAGDVADAVVESVNRRDSGAVVDEAGAVVAEPAEYVNRRDSGAVVPKPLQFTSSAKEEPTKGTVVGRRVRRCDCLPAECRPLGGECLHCGRVL